VDAPKDFGAEHIAVCADKDVQTFDDVEEDLVLRVTNALRSPRHDITSCGGHDNISDRVGLVLFLSFPAFDFVSFRLDIFFQNFNFCNLRVPIVHHFVEKFVGDNEVIPQRLIL